MNSYNLVSGSYFNGNDESNGKANPGTMNHIGNNLQVAVESYYTATANIKNLRAQLTDDIETDVTIVGGGYSGLSTAIALAEKGLKVCVLEAEVIGFGASGRNGGQIINGLNAELGKIERQFGRPISDFVSGLMQEGGKIIRDRIARYGISCDLRDGNIFVATTKRHLKDLEEKKKIWNKAGNNSLEMLDASQVREHVGSEFYCGGMIDHSGGHIHPLNLALGEADAIEQLGGLIFELSPVRRVEKCDGKHVIYTDRGCVRSNFLVLCGNAYMRGVKPELENRILPVSTQIVTTEPLPEDVAKQILPTNKCIEDTRYILDYYRLTGDNRLLFGGGTVYGGVDPQDIRSKLWPNIMKVFPQLEGVKLDYAWSGNFALSFSRVPQMGRTADGAYFAHGYSGHGVTGSHLFGKIIAEAITGDTTRYDIFAGLPYLPFPGGRALRIPYSIAGSWWYMLKDRIGI